MQPIEFDCADCGCHVYTFGREGAPLPLRCGVCAWVAEYVTDPAEAERWRIHSVRLRQRLRGD